MTVELGTTPYSDWQKLMPLLKALGCAPAEQAAAEQWYLRGSKLPEGYLLLAYSSPQQALINAMEQGQPPAEALKHWAEHAQALVSTYKTNRRRAVIINTTSAADRPGMLAEALANQWQESIKLSETPETKAEQTNNPYFQLIATATVHQSPHLKPLLAQLEACTLPLDEAGAIEHTEQNVDALYMELQATWQQAEQNQQQAEQEHKSLEASLKKEQVAHTKVHSEKATLENQLKALKAANKDQGLLEEENQLLLEQLHLVQEELEAKFIQTENLQNRLQSTDAQLAQSAAQQAASKKEIGLSQQRLQKLRDTLENLERTNRALNSNLSEVKNQLAAAKKHQADWEHKYQQGERNGTLALAAANRRISELNAELNKVTKSRTWRLVNPTVSYRKKSKKIAAEKLEQQKTEIQNSDLFNEAWYLEKYPDVAEAGINAIEHYLKTGAYEGRNPSDTFDTTWYLCYYRDVTESGLNPLVHYVRYGRKEERAPRPGARVSLPAPSEQNTTTLNSGEQAI